MPIDPLSERVSRERALTDLISGRDVDDELSRIQSNVLDLRNRFLSRSEGLIAKTGETGRSSVFERSPELDVKMQAALARKRMSLQRSKMEAIFNNAFDLATRYGMDELSANEYARKTAEQTNLQEFEATESEKQRAHKRKLDELENEYAIKGLNLYNEFNPRPDYRGSVLGGVLNVGTEYGLGRFLRSKLRKNKPIYNPNGFEYSPSDRSVEYG